MPATVGLAVALFLPAVLLVLLVVLLMLSVAVVVAATLVVAAALGVRWNGDAGRNPAQDPTGSGKKRFLYPEHRHAGMWKAL
ncbi:MAG: hypothetical protein NZ473_05110 [Candidatus Kapabacteria bacterium]|nr:hypothetical protein [Candidatus Kapabacteria bacterium]MCS7169054.1 hypothetical protein [Candidatus Kapabacteria bacterium]MDW7997287.1 hypothetical protein [Bacteroidota bacterium]MDW8225001.1 hypothetical protein [Bacteroidota bacterium]